jgi:hypothetical protein
MLEVLIDGGAILRIYLILPVLIMLTVVIHFA